MVDNYTKTTAPLGGDPQDFNNWVEDELDRVSDTTANIITVFDDHEERLNTIEVLFDVVYKISLEEAIMLKTTDGDFANLATINNYDIQQQAGAEAAISDDPAAGTITIGLDGWYTLSGYVEATGETNNAYYGVRIDDGVNSFILGATQWDNNNPGMVFSGAIKLSLTAGTTIKMVAVSTTGNLRVLTASFSAEMESLT